MIVIDRGDVAGRAAYRVGGRRVHHVHGGTAAEDSLRGIPHDHPQRQTLQVSGGQVQGKYQGQERVQVQGTCLFRLYLTQPIQNWLETISAKTFVGIPKNKMFCHS